jgi:hypothetical protein
MSHSPQTKTTAAPVAVDDHPVDFNKYVRTCALVFLAVLCATGAMVWISFLPYSWPAKAGMILMVAACNAFVVAGFLMHLISEKKMIYTVLSFTVIFVLALFWLTWYAMSDFPTGTTMH